MNSVPTQITAKLSTIRIDTPISKMMLATPIILLLPYLRKFAPVRQLIIAPIQVMVVIIVDQKVNCESDQLYLILKTDATVLKDPRAKPINHEY